MQQPHVDALVLILLKFKFNKILYEERLVVAA